MHLCGFYAYRYEHFSIAIGISSVDTMGKNFLFIVWRNRVFMGGYIGIFLRSIITFIGLLILTLMISKM
jgi:hypothetical protein